MLQTFCEGVILTNHSNKEMGKGCVKMAQIFHFVILAMLKGLKRCLRVNFAYITPLKVIYSGATID